MRRPVSVVDVFATAPYSGNPVAVVLDGERLSTDQMQRFAHWTNLSETTFVLPPTVPDADYRVRIFTPVAELPSTVGSQSPGSSRERITAAGGTSRRSEGRRTKTSGSSSGIR